MSSNNDDMVLINPFGREVVVPNEIGQELILDSGFKAVNKTAKDALQDPSSLAFKSLDAAQSDDNAAKVAEDIKTGKVTPEATPAVPDEASPAADSPKGDAASEGSVEAQPAPKKRGTK